jgi:hypothetical protein
MEGGKPGFATGPTGSTVRKQMPATLKHFIVAVTFIDGVHITYPTPAASSFDALDAALANFGICKVMAIAA